MLILGHRANKPERIKKYYDKGVDDLEIDIHLCDDVLCLKHGLRKKKLTGLSKLLDKLLGLIILDDPIKPLLVHEALKLLKGIVWLDIKLAGVEEKIVEAFSKYEGEVYYTSFLDEVVIKLRDLGIERVGPIVGAGQRDKALKAIEEDYPVLSLHYKIADRELISKAKDAGVLVGVWTVDDPRIALRLKSLGVDVIITDKPRLIRNALSQR